MNSNWDQKQPFGQNAELRVKLGPDGWVDKLDILYGKRGVRIGPDHGHLVMGPDGDTQFLRTLDGEIRVDKK
jgi:hypothetical protein